MSSNQPHKPTRRSFLKLSAAAASVSAANFAHAAPSSGRIAIVADDASSLVKSEPVQWALGKLRVALTPAHLTEDHEAAVSHVHIATPDSALAKPFPRASSVTQPETVALIPGTHMGKPAILVTGRDARGIVYGLLELADRIRTAPDPILALHLAEPILETTPNKVRSVSRGFCSEVEDKPWYYDRAFWTSYLDTLAAARFNRFAMTFGLAYDFPRGVTDDYFHLPYPYLVDVPGYEQVHIEPALQPGERQRNLETLQFIAAETARRGLEFQLGIWTHAYQWTDSPNSAHHIVGLTPETHAAYCRDALAMILKACPQITGLTMRIHGESGIPEGSYDFWKTLWEAVQNARTPDGKPRVIELDLHAKGLDQRTIEVAQATGMPVKAGCKFWAEHLGLGYQQADIRATEYPRTGVTGTFAVSSGARNFTRYSYGDFYQYPQGAAAGKSLDILYRVWPGTQRHLLWADPALASGYGRAANFCGASGLEIMEPLFFKGREGSGHPGGRDAYADKSLGAPRLASETWDGGAQTSKGMAIPQRSRTSANAEESASQPQDLDTAKFSATYMTWGRHLYNPDTDPTFYHRTLQQSFGPAGPALETALAASSRILPLVTATWCPSASNHEFWPEMFTPLQILPYTTRPLYTDNPAPHNVSAISPLDPQLFTTIGQHAENLVSSKVDARYNSSEVIAALESLVATSNNALAKARTSAGAKARTPEFRRAEEDILILNGLGSYFANLFRAGLHYSFSEGAQSLAALRKARESWTTMATSAQKVYASDISYGSTKWRRGDWADRLAVIDAHIAALENEVRENSEKYADERALRMPTPPRPSVPAHHTAADSFHSGSELRVSIDTPPAVTEAILWYRHVNHGERWRSTIMQTSAGNSHSAVIPADYTNSPYPLQYYFELRTANAATLHPPFNSTWSNQPYYAIHKRT
ncbi:MAG TPA: hypothetical protein VN612_16005 [Acidobacteriaceae bacterium]|nr:hypothetical protein [Acidobacteriaceae bacterium]